MKMNGQISPYFLVLLLPLLFWQCTEAGHEARDAAEGTIDTVPPTTTRTPIPLSAEALAFDRLVKAKADLAVVNGQLGFALVPFEVEGLRLLFYPGPEPDAQPTDSLVYERSDYDLQQTYAPTDFQAFYLKEDYQQLILRVMDLAGRRAEVEINSESGRTMWVDGTAVVVQDWATFLTEVAFVEPLDWVANPVRKEAGDQAASLSGVGSENLLQPLELKGDWLQVKTFSENNDPLPSSGWIRWRRGETVLVKWDYRL